MEIIYPLALELMCITDNFLSPYYKNYCKQWLNEKKHQNTKTVRQRKILNSL